MNDINTIYIFILIFSVLVVLRNLTRLVSTLLQTKPKPMVMNNRELITLGLSISYIITYILVNEFL